MINFNVRGVLLLKGVDNPIAWLTKRGITKDLAEDIVNGKKKQLPYRILEMLCYELMLLPNDVFIWMHDAKHPRKKDHPLEEIHSELVLPNLQYLAQKLDVKDLRKVEEYMKQLWEQSTSDRQKRIEEKKLRGKK